MDGARLHSFCKNYFHVEKPKSAAEGLLVTAKIISYATIILPVVFMVLAAISQGLIDRQIKVKRPDEPIDQTVQDIAKNQKIISTPRNSVADVEEDVFSDKTPPLSSEEDVDDVFSDKSPLLSSEEDVDDVVPDKTQSQLIEEEVKDVIIEKPSKVAQPEIVHSQEEINWSKKVLNTIRTELFDESVLELIKLGKEKGFINLKIFGSYHGTLCIELAKYGKFDKWIPILIENGADLSIQDDNDNTALIWTLANANNTTAMTILNLAGEGKYMDFKGMSGNTALHLGVGKGYKFKSKDGQALKHSNLQVIQELIGKKCNLNLQNEEGNTPLHLACARHDHEMIKALLEANADTTIVNKKGQTAQDLLKSTYQDANELMNHTVKVYVLDEEEFVANTDKALALF